MSEAHIRRDAAALAEALALSRQHHAQLLSHEWADSLHDATAAYAVQDAVASALHWFDQTPAMHWKSGGPSRDTVLTHAALPPFGVRTSGASLADWPMHAPAIEAEIALRLAVDVDAAQAACLTPDSTHGLIDAMTVSIEVVDSRWREGPQAPALLRLADAQSHGALVLGDWVRYTPRDWAKQVCEAQIGDHPPTVRTGTHSLGDPAWLLASWLQHVTRTGASVPAGTIVTTGTWAGVLPAQRGDEVRVSFPGVGAARLTL